MIALSHVSRTHRKDGRPIAALVDVSLAVEAGEFVALVGPSGSGKTTLLNILGLLDAPDAGSVRLAGREVAGLPERELAALRREHVGFVFQGSNLLGELTVLENVQLPLLSAGGSRGSRRSRARELLELVGLAELSACRPFELSGGQQQRAAIARALVGNPRLVLADEPTGDLDAAAEREVLELFQTVAELGTCVVMATHSRGAAEGVARRIPIADGRITGPV